MQSLTQTLSAMPLNQLQQYAQLHRNDPYVVTMALSIANQKKQAMTAQQGQAGQQPQPKVVDSEIAQMAPQAMPEDVGIGQLPAQNMQAMADGGIVGYAGGGEVQRYQYGGVTPRNSVLGDIPGFDAGPVMFTSGQQGVQEEPILRRLYREMNERSAAARIAEEKRRGAAGLSAPSARMLGETAAAQANPAQDMAQFDAASNLYMTERAAKQAAATPANNLARAPSAFPTAAPRTAPPAAGGLGDLSTMYSDILNKQDFKDPAEARLSALEKKELAAAEEAKASLLRDQAKFDDAYSGREKRLSDRETDIGKQKDTNTGLAFLNAGLAIMSTPGGLAAAIGKGAQVGTAQFAAGLDKIRSAQERLDDARDKMEDLKLNRAEMSAKEIRAAEKDIRNVGVDAEKRGIDGIRMAADVNRKTAAEMFKATVDVGVNRERLTSAENIAGMQERGQSARSAAQIAAQLNTPDRLVFDKLLKDNNNDPVKALEAFKLTKGDKFDVRSSYADYLKAFAGKEGVTPPMSMGAYAGQFGATLPR